MVSPHSPTKYTGPKDFLVGFVTRERRPTGADYLQPETGKKYPIGCVWQVGRNPTTGSEGELWALTKIVANIAYWIRYVDVSPIEAIQVDAFTAPGTNPVVPTINGLVTVTGGQVAAGTIGANAIRTDSLAANTFTVEIQRSTAVAASNVINNGISHYQTSDFLLDANAFVSLNPIAIPQQWSNLGIAYNGGTGIFSVCAADGTVLSATNRAYVWLQDRAAPGLLRKYTITANQSFIDDNGASQIIGNLFGLTTGVATSVDIPFFLYACGNDAQDTLIFGISRIPHRLIAPAAANIGTPAAANADVQGSIFLFSSVTIGDYDGNPVLCLGSFNMRMSAADDWTVQTLTTRQGIGRYQEGELFTFPRGQFGAAAGKWFQDNGGTAPNQNDPAGYAYYINRAGDCITYLAINNITTAGVGAVVLRLVLPYVSESGGNNGNGWSRLGGAGDYYAVNLDVTGGDQFTSSIVYTSPGASGIFNNADISGTTILSLQSNFQIQDA